MTSSGKAPKGFSARPAVLPPVPAAPRGVRVPIPAVRFGAAVQAKAPSSGLNGGNRVQPPPIRWPGQGGPLQRKSVESRGGSLVQRAAAAVAAAPAVMAIKATDPVWLRSFITDFADLKVKGVESFVNTVRATKDAAAIAGYEYQALCARMNKASLTAVESVFKGSYSPDPRVDLLLAGGHYIECKCYQAGEGATDEVKKHFFFQAMDYADSLGEVHYMFKHGAPRWACDYLGCINIWQNAALKIDGVKATVLIPAGSAPDQQDNVKDAKFWFKSLTRRVAPLLSDLLPGPSAAALPPLAAGGAAAAAPIATAAAKK